MPDPSEPRTTKVYGVTKDFKIIAPEPKAGENAAADKSQQPGYDVLLLARAIISTIDPASWDVAGGDCSLRIVHRTVESNAWFLVIRQTDANHTAIATLLKSMAGS